MPPAPIMATSCRPVSVVTQHVQVAQHLGVLSDAFDLRPRGVMPVASTTCLKPPVGQIVGDTRCVQLHLTPV
jgi:hypothetical protein